jgi:hypothetical protein
MDLKLGNYPKSLIVSWVLGVLCLLLGYFYIKHAFFTGFLWLILGIVLVPPTDMATTKFFNFKITSVIKIIVFIAVFGLLYVTRSKEHRVPATAVPAPAAAPTPAPAAAPVAEPSPAAKK